MDNQWGKIMSDVVDSSRRTCPVCGFVDSTRFTETHWRIIAVFNGRQRDEHGKKYDAGGCKCTKCESTWDERYYLRDRKTTNVNIVAGDKKVNQE